MNRRELLLNLRNICLVYGIQGILSEELFAAGASPQRIINFVIKYTGGTTIDSGVGQWTYANTLKPLSSYKNDLLVPLGLDSQFKVPMNSHASPQVCALSGAMTGFKKVVNTYYPEGGLTQYTSGGGASIDVLVGKKLQKQYGTDLPYLLITNNTTGQLASTHRTSSWETGGKVAHSISTIKDLSNTVKNKINCTPLTTVDYQRRLAALNFIKANNNIFASQFLINKESYEKIVEQTHKSIEANKKAMGNTSAGKDAICKQIDALENLKYGDSISNSSSLLKKMDVMYDLSLMALKQNVTRSITFNLYSTIAHANSHFIGDDAKRRGYYNISRTYQQSIASFLSKLKQAGLYDNTLVFCNAGSCMSKNVHTYENLSTYVINGGKSGVTGSTSKPKPVGSLLLDILHKFGIKYSTYGGTNHIYGAAKKGGYI